jgi:hypothetical protein
MPTHYATRGHAVYAARVLGSSSSPSQKENTEGTQPYSDIVKPSDPSSFFSILYDPSTYEPRGLPLDDHDGHLTIPYKTYPHPPFVKIWEKIWATPPIVLEPLRLHAPAKEDKFQSAQFRLYFFAENITDIYPQVPIEQGTTLVNRLGNPSNARFIVERCQWVYNHRAYLKVVGITEQGVPFPYNHPVFPSFILVIPVCVCSVPIPDEIKPLIRHEEYDSLYKNQDGQETLCRVCQAIA